MMKVTKPFYDYFKNLRIEMFNTLDLCNRNIDELILIEKCQKLLDRILFIATCEKNYILEDGLFKKVVKNAKQSVDLEEYKVWKNVKNLFESIDKGNVTAKINKFNGGLFSSDKVLEELNIPNEIIEKLCKITEYDFNKEISLNVLGNIFERSIDDIEELKAKICKNENDLLIGKRKREGIFYTPDYITQYIVKRAIDHWIYERMEEINSDDSSLAQWSSRDVMTNKRIKSKKKLLSIYRNYRTVLIDMKVLDPACGSGAFLSEAFNYIYDQSEYVNGIVEELNNKQIECIEVNKHLVAHLDKTILRNNIYGVDLNRESVELAKLSLWLRTASSKDSLVNLDKNIKCGNSLIDDYDVAGKFAFNWSTEFKEIHDNKGFNIIVGNPPYIFSRQKINNNEKEYFYDNYTTTQFQLNTFVLFLEQSIKLLSENGVLGFIIPNTLLRLDTMSKIRKYLLNNGQILEITQLRGKHFGGANVETVILIFKKSSKQSNKILTLEVRNREELQFPNYKEIDISNWHKDEDSVFYISGDIIERQVVKKLQSNSRDLSEFYDVKSGLEAYATGKGNPKQTVEYSRDKVYHSNERKADDYYPYIEGKDVRNYNVEFHNKLWLKYGKHLAGQRTLDIFKRPRVLVREIAGSYPNSILAAYTDEFLLNNRSVINVLSNNDDIKRLKYVTLLLSSKLMSFYYKVNSSKSDRNIFPKIILKDLNTMPIILPEIIDDYIRCYEEIKEFIDNCNKAKIEFINYINDSYNPIKVTDTVQNFYNYEYDVFIHELENLNVVFTEKSKYQLYDIFKEVKEGIRDIQDNLSKLKKNTDLKIYNLYNLSKSEIDYIENYNK
ncbi:MAG: type I restriction-modification system DNA methylase subunit [Clostridium sp.]